MLNPKIVFAAVIASGLEPSPSFAQRVHPSECPISSNVVKLGFHKTEEFLSLSELERSAVVGGFMDAVFASAILGAPATCQDFYHACISSRSSAELAALVERYIQSHPEVRSLPLNVAILDSLNDNCIV